MPHSSREIHLRVAEVLEIYSHDEKGLKSLQDPQRFSSLWAEFQTWARSSGLLTSFHFNYDSGGDYNWWELRVSPIPSGRR